MLPDHKNVVAVCAGSLNFCTIITPEPIMAKEAWLIQKRTFVEVYLFIHVFGDLNFSKFYLIKLKFVVGKFIGKVMSKTMSVSL